MTTDAAFVVELAEGSLAIHDLTVGVAPEDAPVVLAVHGITANGLSWRRVADEVDRRHGPGAVRFLAPTCGGAGAAGPPSALRTGHPRRGPAVGRPVFGADPSSSATRWVPSSAPSRSRRTPSASRAPCSSMVASPSRPRPTSTSMPPCRPSSVPRWIGCGCASPTRRHTWASGRRTPRSVPCSVGRRGRRLGGTSSTTSWRTPTGRGVAQLCVLDAVRADGADVLADPVTHGAARRAIELGLPVELVWARRGLLDEPQGLYDEARLAALAVPEALRTTRWTPTTTT